MQVISRNSLMFIAIAVLFSSCGQNIDISDLTNRCDTNYKSKAPNRLCKKYINSGEDIATGKIKKDDVRRGCLSSGFEALKNKYNIVKSEAELNDDLNSKVKNLFWADGRALAIAAISPKAEAALLQIAELSSNPKYRNHTELPPFVKVTAFLKGDIQQTDSVTPYEKLLNKQGRELYSKMRKGFNSNARWNEIGDFHDKLISAAQDCEDIAKRVGERYSEKMTSK